jgi:hypothetical protein
VGSEEGGVVRPAGKTLGDLKTFLGYVSVLSKVSGNSRRHRY